MAPIAEWATADVLMGPDESRPLPMRFDSAEVTVVEQPDDPLLAEAYDGALLAQARSALRRGHIAVILTSNGRVVARCRVAFRSYRDPYGGIAIRLAPDESYIYDMWVDPERRNGRIGIYMGWHVDRIARSRSRRLYTAINRDNSASQRMTRKFFGHEVIGQVSYVVVRRRWGFQVPLSARPWGGPVAPLGFLMPWDRRRSGVRAVSGGGAPA